ATVRTVRPVRVTTTARSRKYMAVLRSSNERRVRTESDAVEACDAGTAMVILPPGRHRRRSITDCPGTRCCTGNGDHDFAARAPSRGANGRRGSRCRGPGRCRTVPDGSEASEGDEAVPPQDGDGTARPSSHREPTEAAPRRAPRTRPHPNAPSASPRSVGGTDAGALT